MAARIIDDFWNNIGSEENQSLIMRCFVYIINKCPDPEGQDNAYNNLVLNLFIHDVFNRFDKRKLMKSKMIRKLMRKGKSKKAAEKIVNFQMKDKIYTDEDYKNAGIDLRKKFEEYIFSWINKIIREQYDKNGRMYDRMVNSDPTIEQDFSCTEIYPWELSENSNKKSYKTDDKPQKKRGNPHKKPSYIDTEYALATPKEDALDLISARDLKEKVMSSLKSDKERFIYKHVLLENRKEKVIARYLNCSQQYVNIVVNKIRNNTKRICAY